MGGLFCADCWGRGGTRHYAISSLFLIFLLDDWVRRVYIGGSELGRVMGGYICVGCISVEVWRRRHHDGRFNVAIHVLSGRSYMLRFEVHFR